MFWLGVTFYPELWPKDYLKSAFEIIRQSGFNLIRFCEMGWGTVETARGRYDFSMVDETLALCQRNNLKVLMGIGVAQAPPWLMSRHPELRPVAHDGTLHPDYGPRPNACRDSKKYKDHAMKYLNTMVNRYKKAPNIIAWQIDNEPNYPPLDLTTNQDFCHCSSTRKLFIEWLKNKYKNIDELNISLGTLFWSSNFSRFEDIPTPKGGFWDAGNPHLYLEWLRFKSDNLSKWLNQLKTEIRKKDKKRKIGTNNFVGPCNRVPDNRVLAQGMDWYGWDIYPKGTLNSPESLAQHADAWRGLCEAAGAEFIVAELQGGPNVRWGYPGQVMGSEIRNWSHQIVAHGARGIIYHALRAPLYGSETAGFGILELNGKSSPRLEAIQAFSSEIKRIWPELSKFSLKSKVGITYLRSSDVQNYQEQGPGRGAPPKWISGRGDIGLMYTLDAIAGAYRIVWNKLSPAGFVYEKELEESKLDFEVLIITNPYILTEKQYQNIIKFVRSGGTVLTECRFGLKDENGILRENPLLSQLIGANYEFTEIIDDAYALDKWQAKAYGYRDLIKINSSQNKIIAKFNDGYPAIVEKKVGEGKVVVAMFSIFNSLLKYENRKLLKFIQEKYLPEQSVKINADSDIEMVEWSGPSPLLYLINHSSESRKAKLTIGRKYKKARDILSNKILQNTSGKLKLGFGPYGIKIINLLERLRPEGRQPEGGKSR